MYVKYFICCHCYWQFHLITGRMPWSGKLSVLNLLTGQKPGFSPAGATLCTDSRKTWHGWLPPGSAWLCKISPQLVQRGGNAAPKYQKFPLFGKVMPRRGEPLDRFLKFLLVFIHLTILHLCFKFDMIHLTGYGVIAEKLRVGKLCRIVPCTL